MSQSSVSERRSGPLPATVQDLLNQRRSATSMTLNDYVDLVHVQLWPKPAYQSLLLACYDEDAVEGSLTADNIEASRMIRDFSRENDRPEVAGKKLATISKALNIVMRRYRIARKERALTIGGVFMPNEGGGA